MKSASVRRPAALLESDQEDDRFRDPEPAARECVGLCGVEAVLGDRGTDDRAALEREDRRDQREDRDQHDGQHDAPLCALRRFPRIAHPLHSAGAWSAIWG